MTLIRFYPNRLTVSLFRFILCVAVFYLSVSVACCRVVGQSRTTPPRGLIRLSKSCFSSALDVERKGNNTD